MFRVKIKAPLGTLGNTTRLRERGGGSPHISYSNLRASKPGASESQRDRFNRVIFFYFVINYKLLIIDNEVKNKHIIKKSSINLRINFVIFVGGQVHGPSRTQPFAFRKYAVRIPFRSIPNTRQQVSLLTLNMFRA